MPNRSVISVHASAELSERLERLAQMTRRSKSSLANQAIESFVEAEEAFIESINAGLEDVKAGRVSSSDEILLRARTRYLSQGTKPAKS